MAQAKSYGAQLGAADSLLEPKLEPDHSFSHPLMPDAWVLVQERQRLAATTRNRPSSGG